MLSCVHSLILAPSTEQTRIADFNATYWTLPLNLHWNRRRPAIEATECFFTMLFLRRNLTYCAQHRRFADAGGSATVPRASVMSDAKTLTAEWT